MDNLPQSSTYVQPHFNEEAGFSGLWDWEIAQSLGVMVHHVRQKWRRNSKTLMKLDLNVYTLKSSGEMGRPTERVFLSTDLAKYFVCTWVNDLGMGYFKFLLECERVATELTPQLVAENKRLKIRIADLEEQQLKPKRSKIPKTGILISLEFDLFGNEIPVKNRIPIKELSELEYKKGKLDKLMAQNRGGAIAAEKLQAEVALLELRRDRDFKILKEIRPPARLKALEGGK